MVLSTEAYDNNYVGERATLKETYDQIFEDFNTALPLLSKDKHDGYINYWAALALRSRANLYNGQYNEALNDAKEVIACDKYKLYTIDNYEEAWGKEFTDESLFEMKITSVYNAQRNAVGYYCDANGYGECAFVKTAWLYQYLTNNTDFYFSYSKYWDESVQKKAVSTGIARTDEYQIKIQARHAWTEYKDGSVPSFDAPNTEDGKRFEALQGKGGIYTDLYIIVSPDGNKSNDYKLKINPTDSGLDEDKTYFKNRRRFAGPDDYHVRIWQLKALNGKGYDELFEASEDIKEFRK